MNNDHDDRVLGIWYNSKQDKFTFKLSLERFAEKLMVDLKIPTKREVLKL